MAGRDTDQSNPLPAIQLQAWAALSARRSRRGTEPLVTYVDARSSSTERTELSVASVENSVAKIANALRDEFDIEPGAAIGLHLPWHWQRSLWWGGCASVGARVVPYGHPDEVELVACTLADIDALTPAVGSSEILVVSMHPLGLPITDPLPAGFIDATDVVRAQPDAFLPDLPATATPVQVPAQEAGLSGQRVLVARQVPPPALDAADSWAWPLAISLATDGSVVMVATSQEPALDSEVLERLAAQERADRVVLL